MAHAIPFSNSQIDGAIGVGVDIYEANGVIVSDGAGNITTRSIDNTPTDSSTNLVTSGGVKTALDTKINADEGQLLSDLDANSHNITNLAAPTNNGDAARKKYVDDADAEKLDLAGGTMIGAIAMGDNKITGLADGVDDGDAINKGQFDTKLQEYVREDALGDTTVATAEQLTSDNFTENTAPYNFRKSESGSSNRSIDKIVGATLAWNQTTDYVDGITNFTKSVSSNGVLTLTATSGTTSAASLYITKNTSYQVDHKILVYYDNLDIQSTHDMRFYINFSKPWTSIPPTPIMRITSQSGCVYRFLFYSSDGYSQGDVFKVRVNTFDLTQMFGSTIADYIYSLETANAGAGVAFFRALFPMPYSAYNPGQLLSVKALAHITTGFNQWDEEWEEGGINLSTGLPADASNTIRSKNFIPIISNLTYFAYCGSNARLRIFFYDENQGFLQYIEPNANSVFTIPSDSYFVKFATRDSYGNVYKNDICINLSDPAKNGTYEPYEKHSYALDSSKEFRGLYKLDANNKLYADGDVYESDGNVKRNWALLTNQTGAIGDTITLIGLNTTSPQGITSKGALSDIGTLSGTTLTLTVALSGDSILYNLATPTTETAEPFTNPQVVNGDGTEEYVDYAESQGTRDVAIPVGHDTEYLANLVGAIERVMVQVPVAPTSNGTYVLKVTVSGGIPTYAWVAQ